MVKVDAVSCDLVSCGKLGVLENGASLPEGWLLVDIDQDEDHVVNGGMYCSWACVANFANNRIQKSQPVKKRVRRTREQIEADEAAALEAREAQLET